MVYLFFAISEESLEQLRANELTRQSRISDESQMSALSNLNQTAREMLPAGLVLEHWIHPLQAFLILPLFAFFNAGVSLDAATLARAPAPVSLGIVAGLVLGKQIGVMLFSWLAVKSGLSSLPEGVRWGHVWGVSCLAGVGFTMSLFIGELAFEDPGMIGDAKLGILVASLVAGAVGYLVLSRSLPGRTHS